MILTMNRLRSLQRLVRSLMNPDCGYGTSWRRVDLEFHTDRPKRGADAAWRDTLRWTTTVQWPYGNVKSLVARENMGLRDAWFQDWKPSSHDDRTVILEDDVEVSPLWFRWVNGAYDAYARDGKVAGFSLQRQHVVPLKDKALRRPSVPANGNEPFLYSLLGSIGFAPNPRVWTGFLDWTVSGRAATPERRMPRTRLRRSLERTPMSRRLREIGIGRKKHHLKMHEVRGEASHA